MVVSVDSVPLKANCRMANLPSREIRPRKVISDIRRNETDSVARYSVALISIFRTDNGGNPHRSSVGMNCRWLSGWLTVSTRGSTNGMTYDSAFRKFREVLLKPRPPPIWSSVFTPRNSAGLAASRRGGQSASLNLIREGAGWP